MFRFKRFAISQDRCSMKVGTDGVLLGAWVGVEEPLGRILDIGTATGVIALMMAQRTATAQVTGIDIEDVSQAQENGDSSEWRERLSFCQCAVQDFNPDSKFDLIVSNPPFFNSSLLCDDSGRSAARHTISLSFEDLVCSAERLLRDAGRFAVVLPADAELQFKGLCAEAGLALTRQTNVQTNPTKPAKRLLMEFTKGAMKATVEPTNLVISNSGGEDFTRQYRALTQDFYLKF